MSNILNVVVSEQEPDIPIPDTDGAESPDTGVYTAATSDYANDIGMEIVLPVSILAMLLVILTSTLIYKLTHKDKKLHISHKKFGIFIFLISLSVGGLGVFVANYLRDHGVSAANNVEIITTDTTIAVTKGDEPRYAKAKAEIVIKDETTDGFDLYVYAPNGNILTNGSSEVGINPVEGAKSVLAINTWGATDVNNSNVSYSDAVWNPVSATESEPLLIATTNEETVPGKKVTVYYGVYVDSDLPVGTYSANIEYKLSVHPATHYEVCFDANGGTVADTCKSVEIDQPVGELPVPTMEYYNFVGWFDQKEGGNEVTAATVLNEKTTVYAHWDRIKYTITFDANEGVIDPAEATRVVNAGEQFGSLPVPTRENYTFTGWYDQKEGGNRITTASMPTATTEYYAHWSKDTYLITFDANGGTIAEADATRTIEAGDVIGTLPEATLTHFELIGWFDEGENQIDASTKPAGATTYHAEWRRIVSTITFDANGGTIAAQDATRNVNEGEVVGDLPIATMENHTFLGWFTEAVDGNEVHADTLVEEKTVTYYAHYDVIVHTITFDPNGGTIDAAAATRYVNAGSALGELPEPTRENYNFAGWWTEKADGAGDEISAITEPDSSKTYYAHWDRIEYTITYDLKGGNIGGSTENPTATVYAGDTLGTLPTPTKTDHTFVGWWTAETGGNMIDASTRPDSSTTYFARWDRDTYTITFDAGEGTITEQDASRTIEAGEVIGELPEATLLYHDLVGWFDEDENQIDASTRPTGATTYHAQWRRIVSEVTFDPNGGTIAEQDASREVEEGRAVGELPSATQNHYTFVGWFTAAEDGTQIDAETIVTERTVTYYAHWQQKQYTITFDPNGGTIAEQDATRNVAGGNTLGELPGATKDDLNLIGWFTAAEGGDQVYANTIPDDTITYYAHWGRASYTITFDANGGTFDDISEAIRSVNVGSTLGALPGVSYTNYDFVGWFTKRSGGSEINENLVPEADTTYYAHWNRIVYTITFVGNGGEVVEGTREVLAGKQIGNLYTSTRDGYTFTGWYTSGNSKITNTYTPSSNMTLYAHWTADVFPDVWSQEGACNFNAYKNSSDNKIHGLVSGEECSDYAGNEYIDTGISLYTSSNINKDYEIGFTIDHFVGSEQKESQATIMNTKNEASGYPGVLFRRSSGSNNLEISSRKTSSKNADFTPVSASDITSVKIVRKDNSIYYAFNGGSLIELNTLEEYNPTFGQSVWFGASPANGASRFIVGTLSNMYIRLGDYRDVKTVTFDPNGGTVNEPTRTVYSDYQIGELPLPILDGYRFVGWFTAADGGAKIDTSTYVYSDTTYYAHWEESGLTISFDGNGGTVNESSRRVPEQTQIGDLPKATRRDYVNSGWYTDPAGGEEVTSDYIPDEDMDLYANWELNVSPLAGVTYFQDFTSLTVSQEQAILDSMTEGIGYSIIDKRDNKEYIIVKLAGDRLFMRENLRLDNTTDGIHIRTLTPTDSDVTSDYTMPTENWSSSSQNYYCKGAMAEVDGEYYYNWYAAKANSTVCENPTNSANATEENDSYSLGSICPAGWTLPDYTLDILPSTIVNNGYNPGNIGTTGYFNIGKKQAGNDRLWSDMRVDNQKANYLMRNSAGVVSVSTANKTLGQGVRCMRAGYTITFDANDDETPDTYKNIRRGAEVGSLPVIAREGYNLAGWYTALEGGEKVTDTFVPNASMTLYARWEDTAPTIDGITYLQDFATLTLEEEKNILASLDTNTYYNVKDKRDGKDYTITKLGNGYLWMRENLALENVDGGETRVLTPADSDVTADYTMPDEEWTSSSQNYYCKAIMAEANGEYYYNWYTAKANPNVCEDPTNSNYATEENDNHSLGSICPAGWTLPDKNDDFLSALYSNNNNYGNLNTAGYYNSGAQTNVGTSGGYWTSSRNYNSSAFNIGYGGSNATLASGVKSYGRSVRCIRRDTYKIKFNSNGGNSVEGKTIGWSSVIGELPVAKRAGHIFDGWYTALIGGEKVESDFVPTGDMTLYAHWAIGISYVPGIIYFQDFDDEHRDAAIAAMDVDTKYAIRDKRDEKEYTIVKLSNGYLYMSENLRLDAMDGDEPRVLTSEDSDVTTDFTMPTEEWTSSAQNYYCKAIMAEVDGEYYYNWYAAKANSNVCENPTSSTNSTVENDKSTGSICPAEWTLPDYTSEVTAGIGFDNLKKSGWFASGSVTEKNSEGAYWSRVRYTNVYAYTLRFYSDTRYSYGSSQNYKYSGNSVRCILKPTVSISFNSNGGNNTPMSKNIKKGNEIGKLPFMTKNNAYFIGWYTALDGGEKVDESFVPTRSMTLYAHYESSASFIDGITYFQDFVDLTEEEEKDILDSMDENKTYSIKDKRDEKVYIITKLSDGTLYMRDNLKLSKFVNGNVPRKLTPEDSDVSMDYYMPILNQLTDRNNSDYYCRALMAQSGSEFYYNWYAATANPYISCKGGKGSEEEDDLSLGSICPAGWTLPNYSTDILLNTLYNNPDNFANYSDTGYVSGSKYSSNGYYWSDARYSEYSAYSLEYYSSSKTLTRRSLSKYIGASVRCMRDTKTYKVSFDANGGRSFKTKRIEKGSMIDELPIPERAEHTFIGWYTALDGGEKVTERFIPDSNITIYARWETDMTYISPEIVYFQDFAALSHEQETAVVDGMEADKSYLIKDKRDEKVYRIVKLSNGRLYMRDNLKLSNIADDNARVLTPEDSDVYDNYTMSTEAWGDSETSGAYKGLIGLGDDEFYYSMATAETKVGVGGTASYSNSISLGSICPAGWTLPDYNTDIKLDTLYENSINHADLSRKGYYYRGWVSKVGENGYYWNASTSSYMTVFTGKGINNTNTYSSDRDYGISVRCTNEIRNRVHFDPNGGKLKEMEKRVKNGISVDVLPVPEKDNMIFAGWFTERDGGTKIENNYVPDSDITLYAHWDVPSDLSVEYFQDFVSLTRQEEIAVINSMTKNVPYSIKDKRDDKAYTIMRLDNDTLYMSENLKLDSRTITPNDSDVISDYNMPTDAWTSSAQNYYCRGMTGQYYGEYYYNWYAATANPYSCEDPTTDTNATEENDANSLGSICPAGWTLPDYLTDIPIDMLYKNNTIRGNLHKYGDFVSGSLLNLFSTGYYWTNSRSDNQYAFSMVYGSYNTVLKRDYTVNKYIGLSVRCMRRVQNKITFEANGGVVDEAERYVYRDETIGSLPIPTRENYEFYGWYTAIEGGEIVAENYMPIADTPLYARWRVITKTFDDIAYFQDFASLSDTENKDVIESMKKNKAYSIKDLRDDKTYSIVRLDNDYLYMRENLMLDGMDGDEPRTLTPANSDVTADFIMPTDEWGTQDYYCKAMMVNVNGEYYYNWYAAKANPYVCTDPTTYTESTLANDALSLGSICPAGWTLPDYKTDILPSYSSNAAFSRKGYYSAGQQSSLNSYGYYWTYNRQSDQNGSALYYYSSSSVSLTNVQKNTGRSVRCMRGGTEYKITFDPNGGIVDTKSKNVLRDDKMNALPTPTRDGYVFVGWYSTIVGGERVTEYYHPVSDMVIYARWEPDHSTIDGATYLQDFANFTREEEDAVVASMSSDIAYSIKDARDNQSYVIRKSSDGFLYMSENLRLDNKDGEEYRVLHPTDSDVSADYRMPTEEWTTQRYYCKGMMVNIDGEYYYNWYAAKANPYVCSNPSYSSYADEINDAKSLGSICPAGWTLPDMENKMKYTKLRSAGYWSDGSLRSFSSNYSEYWSNARVADNKVNAYALRKYSNDNSSNYYDSNPKYYGLPVTCIRYTYYRIRFETNGGTFYSNYEQKVSKGSTIGYLSNPSRNTGWKFVGWYTELDGGERIANQFVPTSDMTLYAHWEPIARTIDGITYFQDFANLNNEQEQIIIESLDENVPYLLKDKRDEKEYMILKLSNGRLYMYEDLRLDGTTDGTTARVLTPQDSDVSASFVMNSSEWSSSSQNYYCKANMKKYDSVYYYNWYEATANPFVCDDPTTYNDATEKNDAKSLGSICPAGWTLPDYETDISMEVFNNKNIATFYTNGYYYSGSLYGRTNYGYLWSSERYSNSGAYIVMYRPASTSTSVQITREIYSKYYAAPVRCVRDVSYKVSFDLNGGISNTISGRKVGRGEEIGELPTAGTIERTGYKFAGWYTAIDGGERVTEHYVPTSNIVLYAHYEALVGGVYFQDFVNLNDAELQEVVKEISINEPYVLIDKRDSKEYRITRLENGYLYMLDNLKLDNMDGNTIRTLHPADSDVTADYTMPNVTWSSSSQNYYCRGVMKEVNGEYYYNWYAATANPTVCSNPTSSSYATAENDALSLGSICPAGWTLPDYSSNRMIDYIYSGSVNYGDLNKTGVVRNGAVQDSGTIGSFWSNTRYNNAYAYNLRYSGINVSRGYSSEQNYKYYGNSVRCIKDVAYTVNYDANGGTASFADQRVVKGGKINKLPVVTRSPGWNFVGWYTALVGGEKVTESFMPTTDITLYARYESEANTIDGIVSFQDFANLTDEEEVAIVSSMETNVPYVLKDNRDNKQYTVTKLKTGYLYMLENLKLDSMDGNDPMVLHPADSDVTADYTMPYTTTWSSDSQDYYCRAVMKEVNGEYYYNWYAAKANPYICSSPTSYTYSTATNDAKSLGSICPAGWTLPSYNGDISPDLLNLDSANYANLTANGRVISGVVDNNGVRGGYWSSDRYSNAYAYSLIYNGTTASLGYVSDYKTYGNTVRCVRKSTFTVTYDTNGGTATFASKIVPKGGSLVELPFVSKDGSYFRGWYTAADGGNRVDENYVPTADTTIYAHFDDSAPAINGIVYFQDFKNLTEEQEADIVTSMETNMPYAIKDKRDEKVYSIVKLNNGALYMRENLKLDNTTDGSTTRVLTSADSDVIADYTMPTEAWTSSSQNYYCKGIMAIVDGEYYYNMYAAQANPTVCSSPTQSSGATDANNAKSLGSICPAGWSLPTYNTDVPLSALQNKTARYADLDATGSYSSGSRGSFGSYGYIWGAGKRFIEFYPSGWSGNYVFVRDSNSSSSGFSVRCTRDSSYTVIYKANGGTIRTTKKKVVKNETIGALETPTRTDGYTFVGWFTQMIGGEEVTEDYKPASNMTFYAHWETSTPSIQGVTYFQDFKDMSEEDERAAISSMEVGVPYTLKDRRDGNIYRVVKLENGHLFMSESLKLDNYDNGEARVLTSADSDVKSNFTMPIERWVDANQDYYCKAIMAEVNGSYYYNWYTVKANPYVCQDPTTYTDATSENNAKSLGSICPAGWTLPKYDETDIPVTLLYNDDELLYVNHSGLFRSGYSADSYGYYWSASSQNYSDRPAFYIYTTRPNYDSSREIVVRGTNSGFFGFQARCMRNARYVVKFNTNGGTHPEEKRIVAKGDEIGELPVPKRTSIYRFVGWFTSLEGGERIEEDYIPVGDITLYAHYETIADTIDGVEYFQDFKSLSQEQEYNIVSKMETNVPYTIKDNRDGKQYAIVKLSNGYLYMYDNLKLDNHDGDEVRVLHPADSDVKGDFTMPTSTWVDYQGDYYCKATMIKVGGEYYYNWYTAKANPYQCSDPRYSSTNGDSETLGSICPAGWKLPKYTTEDIELGFLFNGSENMANLELGGLFESGSQRGVGEFGFYWSSVSSGSGSAYNLSFNGVDLRRGSKDESDSRYKGQSVRCMRDSTHIVKLNANGGVGSVATKKIAGGGKIGELEKPSRNGYNFLGWYTELVGGVEITENYIPPFNATVYAHWESTMTGIPGITYFQDFEELSNIEESAVLATMVENQRYSIKDARDNKEYTIVKLSNSYLYMTEDLRLDARTLTPEDSDVATTYTMPTSAWSNTSCEAKMVISNSKYYYNWYAAKANTDNCSDGTDTEASKAKSLGSICPAGWTLPDYVTDITPSMLYNVTENIGNLKKTGYYSDGIIDGNNFGYYHSSTSGYNLRYYADHVATRESLSGRYGKVVRCMRYR